MMLSVLCSVCVCSSAGDGVLRRRLGHRPAEEDQRELSEGGLDLLHLQRGSESESAVLHTLHCYLCEGSSVRGV